MSAVPDTELRQRLKSAIWFTVGKIVDEECVQLGANATPQYIAALTELVYTQAVTLAADIESFAHHAGRKVVSTDDILMMCRRNDGLKEVLSEFVEDLESKKKEQKNSGKALR
ncbi:kinetochore component CENP-S-domain-containing protein [Lipomyces kononenkoae]